MRHRTSSPTPSTAEVDILNSLVQEDDGQPEINESLDFGGILGEAGDDGDSDEAFIESLQRKANRKTTSSQGKTVKKGGGFQAMGLGPHLLRNIARKGFQVPTPIQRKTIPLILEGKDVVGMARTGSGKTAAFVIPLIHRLKSHSSTVGARAILLSPSRELALQTLKVVKELGRGTDLKTALIVGGDSIEDQFGIIAGNPDIIIATPGRLLHLKVEMRLNLSSVGYMVFDEADKMFEDGFATTLHEILHALPLSRQTLLFSATLPSSLVEFARAGLQDPSLVRLDAESKISPDLSSHFFSVKGSEKEGALIHILQDIICIPHGRPEGVEDEAEDTQSRKRKRASQNKPRGRPTKFSTLVFAATKHEVEYLASLLDTLGFAISYVYGALDQVARRQQVENFCRGRTHILITTDVAARGIDMPALANVCNYSFPSQPKIYVHRVGRTARAGQRGSAYSLVRPSDAPYLIDLQLFLGRRLVVGSQQKKASFASDIVVGSLQRALLDPAVESFNTKVGQNDDLNALRRVSEKAERLYLKTRNGAASQSVKRAREITASKHWEQLHLLFGEAAAEAEEEKSDMLQRISGYKTTETVFELGPRGRSDKNKAANVARNFRLGIKKKKRIVDVRDVTATHDGYQATSEAGDGASEHLDVTSDSEDGEHVGVTHELEESDSELEVTVTSSGRKKDQLSFQDPEHFISYVPRSTNLAAERGYGIQSGSSSNANFLQAARHAAMDLINDDSGKAFGEPTRAKMRWDKKARKYVSRDNDVDGSRGSESKMIKGESGVKIAASFQSGRFERWRKAERIGRLPRTGDAEKTQLVRQLAGPENGPRYKHKATSAPKDADKFRDDYHVRKRRVAEAREKRIGKYAAGAGSNKELKSAMDIRKARELQEKKRAKNARPTKRVRR